MQDESCAIQFLNVSRHYGDVCAVDRVSMTIGDGEFFSMLGPSGSGKTTCLRLIAGFERPTGGEIQILGEKAAHLPPYARRVNTVFQDYALFPHMNLLDNVAYGLMVRGVGKKERYKRAEEALELVALPGFGGRRPSQLSGGQRQRVALARALVTRPPILLLDEPLGALDLKLREQMQVELKNLQRQLKISFIFVTHDQTEALSMSDRVAVFNRGRIEQVASPQELYQRPKTAFVAEFVGGANIIKPALAQRLGLMPSLLSLRPEFIHLKAKGEAISDDFLSLEGRLLGAHYHGATTRCEMATPDGASLVASLANTVDSSSLQVGEMVTFVWPRVAMVALEGTVSEESCGFSRKVMQSIKAQGAADGSH
ncbi:ABC transporter ATP-binding protein [Bartonella sp. DGB2]|uniref:ABC transporter ATP-binding protein n=1 Tax=Bartonella sp. DGB2 TaxID=3388426 RepID=UPI003990344B